MATLKKREKKVFRPLIEGDRARFIEAIANAYGVNNKEALYILIDSVIRHGMVLTNDDYELEIEPNTISNVINELEAISAPEADAEPVQEKEVVVTPVKEVNVAPRVAQVHKEVQAAEEVTDDADPDDFKL